MSIMSSDNPGKHTTSFRHPYNIHTTSITLKRRRTDVKTTSCAYWKVVIHVEVMVERVIISTRNCKVSSSTPTKIDSDDET